MRNDDIGKFAYYAPQLFKNTHLHFTLSGWPASVALIAISLSGIAIYGINCYVATNTSQQKPSRDVLLNNV